MKKEEREREAVLNHQRRRRQWGDGISDLNGKKERKDSPSTDSKKRKKSRSDPRVGGRTNP